MAQPRLLPVHMPSRPVGVALVLHGGGSRPGSPMVSPTQLSVLRMKPIALRVAHRAKNVAVYRLLNSHRGWDPSTTPVHDARWAMDVTRDRWGDLPVALVGHSLGGRAALLAGSAPDVRCVVALNPWVLPSDVADLRGRRVLVVHGSADRIAPIERARVVADRLARTTDVTFEVVEGAKHAMLRQGAQFEKRAAEFVAETLGAGRAAR
ncbi:MULTISPECIES: dienelactone hydrolase family protein [unclassified Nocardioides]|uniref:poly(ethylene terephthalate) hydrolase family protein n=1 Tax=unclassified Nocardioides TaxID=2615069 RepID=UPI00240564F6|nr:MULTISPECIES: dienelactone hydrolase family protein [unclassified Nocardioides]